MMWFFPSTFQRFLASFLSIIGKQSHSPKQIETHLYGFLDLINWTMEWADWRQRSSDLKLLCLWCVGVIPVTSRIKHENECITNSWSWVFRLVEVDKFFTDILLYQYAKLVLGNPWNVFGFQSIFNTGSSKNKLPCDWPTTPRLMLEKNCIL